MLHLLIPELPAAARAGAASQLPGFGALLQWSRAPEAETDWRRGLARDLGIAPAPAPASLASCALPASASGSAVWFAQPVHQIAGMSRVHLHPEGVLRLGNDESRQFAGSFAGVLGGAGWVLHAVGDGLLLTGPPLTDDSGAGGRDDEDPVRWLGRELQPARAGLPQALQRLAAETEMWLHDLPLNRARERRGELPVTGLWFWGGADICAPSSRPVPAQVARWSAAGADPFLLGLAAQGVCDSPVIAGSFMEWAPGARTIAVLSPAWRRGAPDWEDLDARWLTPLAQAMQQRSIEEIVLRFGGSRWRLRRRPWSDWWRRAVPGRKELPA